MLDKRLAVCADFVRGGRVCDVGTDHAYLTAELLKSGKCLYAIAADINIRPLKAAEKTLKKYGVEEKAEIVLSDGMLNIDLNGVTDIVIAGMGGELIKSVLNARKTELEGINLILQPMSKHSFLRRWLCENGFKIIKEKAVIDNRHYYTVINACYTGTKYSYDDIYEHTGELDFNDKEDLKYIKNRAERLLSISGGLRSGGSGDAALFLSLGYRILRKAGFEPMLTVNDIYTHMNRIAPMAICQEGDNSGILTGSLNAKAGKILLCLDITNDTVAEAIEKNAGVIISHHPVIYNPLYSLNDNDPACYAYKNGIACLCFHSPLDIAAGGINDIIYSLLKKPLMLSDKKSVLEPVHPDGSGYGIICESGAGLDAKETAGILKEIFGCTVVRYFDNGKPIKKLAFCSGGGAVNTQRVIDFGLDAFITGDVKHDRWITAKNYGLALFDSGHYHTEVIALEYIRRSFLEAFPGLDISIARCERDPVEYII